MGQVMRVECTHASGATASPEFRSFLSRMSDDDLKVEAMVAITHTEESGCSVWRDSVFDEAVRRGNGDAVIYAEAMRIVSRRKNGYS